jgi:hypothetical protein
MLKYAVNRVNARRYFGDMYHAHVASRFKMLLVCRSVVEDIEDDD